ncbi:MAG: hypothetical protein K2K80_00055 [Clostridia bacterium]|nr:hypothetical protein [Clostridia bacterium]
MTKDNALKILLFRELPFGARKQACLKDITFQLIFRKLLQLRKYGFVTRYQLRQMIVCFGG